MTTLEDLKTGDWDAAFKYAEDFTADDVVQIHGAVEGWNEGDDWIIWGRLHSGAWFSLKAGCDYTGWDCQANGTSYVASTKEELIRMGMDFGMRQRFGISQPE